MSPPAAAPSRIAACWPGFPERRPSRPETVDAPVPAIGTALALASALAWAAFDATRKRLSATVEPAELGLWITAGQVPFLALWAALQGPFAFPAPALLPAAASVGLNAIGILLLLQALQKSPFSLTIPLLSLTPVGTTALAWVARGQMPTLSQAVGAVLVLGGALVLGLRTGTWPGLRAYLREPGVWRMTLCATIWSATAVLDQMVVARGAGSWYAPLLALGVALGMAGLARNTPGHGRRALRALGAQPWSAAGALLSGALGLVLQLEAFRHAPAGFVETLKRGIAMVSAVVLGRLLFREMLTWSQGLGIALMTFGVALVVGG